MTSQEKPVKTCTCDWLKNAADDARFPIEYDRQTNQFKLCCQLGGGEVGYTVLHFCPFCGCKAPDIRKEQLFTEISEQEFLRLRELTRQISSIEDAFRILGEPELLGSEQELLDAARSLTYQHLSESATIHIIEYENGNVRIVIQEKYIGTQPPE
jgi:hypothetical protein